MTATPQGTVMDRLAEVVPKAYRQEATRLARRIRDHLPPVAIEHRIDALERHFDRRFKDIEAKLDEVIRRLGGRTS